MVYYEPIPASDGTSLTAPSNAEFRVFEVDDIARANPVELRTVAGTNAAPLVTTAQGVLPGVEVVSPNFSHIFKSGEWEWRRDSVEGIRAAAEGAQASAAEAVTLVKMPTDQAVDAGIARADIPGTVAKTVAATPTVLAAAAAAVDADPRVSELRAGLDRLDASAVLDGDPRLLEDASNDQLSFGVVDQDGRRLWLEAGLDGKPTPYAADTISGAIGMQDVNLDNSQMAIVDSEDRIIFTPPRDYPTADWAHWGDSITDDLITGAESWVTKLSAKTGQHHYNGGWYNQKHDQIAARQGGLPAIVTVGGNATLPTGGTVISTIINSPVLFNSTRAVRGTLAGIPGRIQQTYIDVTLFYPDTPGVYQVPPKSHFIPADGLRLRDRHVTIWSGRNNVIDGNPEPVVASTQAMIDYLTPQVKRVMVLEILPSTSDGAAGKAKLDDMNAALKSAFRPYWLPIASWLRTEEAATAAGITFTDQDRADIAASLTPTSFRSDYVHLDAAGCTAAAHRVYQEAQKRGWL